MTKTPATQREGHQVVTEASVPSCRSSVRVMEKSGPSPRPDPPRGLVSPLWGREDSEGWLWSRWEGTQSRGHPSGVTPQPTAQLGASGSKHGGTPAPRAIRGRRRRRPRPAPAGLLGGQALTQLRGRRDPHGHSDVPRRNPDVCPRGRSTSWGETGRRSRDTVTCTTSAVKSSDREPSHPGVRGDGCWPPSGRSCGDASVSSMRTRGSERCDRTPRSPCADRPPGRASE